MDNRRHFRPTVYGQKQRVLNYVHLSQDYHNSQYEFQKNLTKPTVEFPHLAAFDILDVMEGNIQQKGVQSKVIKIIDVGLTKPQQFVRAISMIQWLIYTEFEKLNVEDIQKAVQAGNGRPIRKTTEILQTVYRQMTSIVTNEQPKTIEFIPTYSSMFKYDQNGVRMPIKATTRSAAIFTNTTRIFVCMYLLLTILFAYATGFTPSVRNLWYRVLLFIVAGKYKYPEFSSFLTEIVVWIGAHPCGSIRIEKKLVNTVWGPFTIDERMVLRDNKICTTSYDAARPKALEALHWQNSVITVEPKVKFILVLEDHATANYVVQYIIKMKYDDMIVVETSGCDSLQCEVPITQFTENGSNHVG